jgi:diadenosine tetraphosphate (Ap4A) HIT family hydrolase
MDCIFCKIINGDIPSYTVYEDDYVKCFLDINPIEMGHTLIVPKKHFIDNNDIDDEYLLKVHEASKIIVEKINKELKPDGIKLSQNNGCLQDVKHYHLHIIPKFKKKKVKLNVEDVFKLLTNN